MDTDHGYWNIARNFYFSCDGGGIVWSIIGILIVIVMWYTMFVFSDIYPSVDTLIKFMIINAMISTYGHVLPARIINIITHERAWQIRENNSSAILRFRWAR
jgi:hypothetical protein